MMTELPPLSELQTREAMYALLVSMYQELVALRAENARLRAENEELKRMLFGQRSERVEPIERELQKKGDKRTPQQKKQQQQRKRQQRQEQKKKLPEKKVIHKVAEDELQCPSCGGEKFVDVGSGDESVEYEFVPAQIIKIVHVREKKACTCGSHIVTAPGPSRVVEGCQYGPGLHAHVAVSKCQDGLPLYRQSKQFGRAGFSIPKSSLGDLFHRTADLLRPLWCRMLELVAEEELVNADETRIKVQQKKKTRTAWIWTFLCESIVAFVFSASRSGKTPEQVLQNSTGFLQVDGYTGYNEVCTPENRIRAGCWAHVRRYFFKALGSAEEEVNWVLSQILELYQVEYDAAEKKVLGKEQHLMMRKTRSKEVLEELKEWLERKKAEHPPGCLLSKAIGYTLNNWESLVVFLKDARVGLDNNVSERTLRTIAVGRKNFLFVGNDKAGESLAILQSLCASCDANGVNAQAYLADVLIRIQSHPNNRIDELLPHNWLSLQNS